MRSPQPFEPHWELSLGPMKRSGRGLVPRELNGSRDQLDEFRVFVDGSYLRLFPKIGRMFLGTSLLHDCKQACKLVWYRRMCFTLNPTDPNTSPAECSWYGAGLDTGKEKHGVRVMPDGKVMEAHI